MTEREFQRTVIATAKLFGWKTAHFGNTVKIVRRGSSYTAIPDADASGFPDLVMVRKNRLVFAELKGKKGKLSAAQSEWLAALSVIADGPDGDGYRATVEVYTWRPNDIVDIENILR